uniref:Uncharacterized protein n=1 Tax=Opuntia streptacantha TaxID=393608 RepID=A0A7C9EWH1_OPUST
MTSSRSIDIVPSESDGMKTFLTTGTAPCTSYNPNFKLKVASPKSAPDGNASKAANNALFVSSINSSEDDKSTAATYTGRACIDSSSYPSKGNSRSMKEELISGQDSGREYLAMA